jgi:3-oxoacyl-[acyl-carrier-protein] synthase-3
VSETTTAKTPLPPRTAQGLAIAGLGIALPDTVVSNAEVAERIGKDERWIETRTGITERRVMDDGLTLAELAARAARAALADAGATIDDVDLILLATASPDDLIPTTAPEVAGLLGTTVGAIDIGAACTGFITALQLAAGQLESGRAGSVLVIGAEQLTRMCDPHDKQVAMIFGDAAGAALVRSTPGGGELGPVILRTEPGRDMLYADRTDALIRMQGPDVFKHAVLRMTEVTQQIVDAAGIRLDDIDLFVYHQANSRIVKAVGERLDLDTERVVDCIATVGNASAASIPVALQKSREDGRLKDGSRILLSAFGAGFIWGGAVLDWRASA